MSTIDEKATKELNERINLHLAHRGINKLRLSKAIGLSSTYVGDMARGVRQWNPNAIKRFVSGLQLDEREEKILHALGARSKGWNVDVPE